MSATCVLSYDANGGSGAPSPQSHVLGSTSKISDTIPIKKGYVFLGWSTDKTATSATYLAGDDYVNEDASAEGETIILYAVWIESLPNMHVRIPDGKSFDSIYVKVPEGKSLSAVYYRAN